MDFVLNRATRFASPRQRARHIRNAFYSSSHITHTWSTTFMIVAHMTVQQTCCTEPLEYFPQDILRISKLVSQQWSRIFQSPPYILPTDSYVLQCHRGINRCISKSTIRRKPYVSQIYTYFVIRMPVLLKKLIILKLESSVCACDVSNILYLPSHWDIQPPIPPHITTWNPLLRYIIRISFINRRDS